MKEKKQLVEDEKVKQLIAKNQNVIEALKRLNSLISNECPDQKACSQNDIKKRTENLVE
jgi:hypothetical protein